MSESGSNAGSKAPAAKSKVNMSRVAGSQYSVNNSMRKSRASLKEEMIAKKITEIFKEKEQRMIRTIEATIVEDRLRIYKQKRAEFEEELAELEADRKRIVKRKKNKKERMKLLKANTRSQLVYIAKALNSTVIYYKQFYYENDYYRFKKLLDVQNVPEGEPPMDEKGKQKAQLEQLNNFFNSPFKEDRRFTIYHLAQMTRDRLESSNKLVNALFFDKIFKMLLTTQDEKNKLKAFEILCNLIQSPTHRKRLAKEGYFRQVYETMQIGKIDDRTLEKLSWMTTLICFHPDMIEQIVSLRLLNFIIKLVESKFSATIRSNAVLAISLLTYHESLFNELIGNGVIDIVMDLCMDVNGDIQVKQFSTLALVHFALSKQSINILIDKGVMDLFNSLGVIDNAQIQTNVSWIFLALCNNGITGKQMLINGITRDMFLVSCNPQFHQIRHLVIAGFAELGRCTDLTDNQMKQQTGSLQRIKEKAIVGMHDAFRLHAIETIDILLRFTISSQLKFIETAFWALKDYILLNHDCLIEDLSGVICAFVNGSAESSETIKQECANAISFLITHQLVFNKKEADYKKDVRQPGQEVYEFNHNFNYVLDALMMLSGSESLQVRTRAFSTLSTLSTYASQSEDVMPQILADISMPQGVISRQYYKFITERIAKSRESFTQRYLTQNIEKKYAGLYCLLRLGQCPEERIAIEAGLYLHAFYYPEYYADRDLAQLLELHTRDYDIELSFEQKQQLSLNLGKDSCDTRNILLDPLNEKFFMFVFQALLYSKNVRILYLILDVINFYIKHDTEHQNKVINASTILWMLQILDKNRLDRDLCLLVAKTVLKIVDNHQILFDYQEMAIIKKFNRALENLNLDPNEQISGSSDEEEDDSIHGESQSQSAVLQGKSQEFIKMVENAKQQLDLNIHLGIQGETTKNERELSHRNALIEFSLEEQLEIQRATLTEMSEEEIQAQTAKNRSQNVHQSKQDFGYDRSIEESQAYLQEHSRSVSQRQELEFVVIKDPESLSENNDQVNPLDQQLTQSQRLESNPSPNNNSVGLNQKLKIRKSESLNEDKSSQKQRSSYGNTVNQPEQQSLKLKKNVSKKSSKAQIGDQSESINGVVVNSGRSIIPTSNQSEYAKANNELRDALIKSFMVIFTNEKSQHLLLNQDIIDIAFNCLEYCENISIDAKKNLARLISIIFKFPQVQERILQDKIVQGIVHLLQQDSTQSSIITHALRSCTYIALSYDFVNSPLSLQVLKALTPLMDRLEKIGLTLASQKSSVQSSKGGSPAEALSDQDNCLFAIANLLKGNSVNAIHFINSDGPRKVMQELLKLIKEPKISPEKMEIIELCVSSIKQLANTKLTFREFLAFSALNKELLTECIQRVFALSDQWYQHTNELLRFNKVFRNQEKQQKVQVVKKLDTDAILKLDHNNVEHFKALELMEQQEEMSIRMASIIKIRNNVYYIVVGCLKSGFKVDFVLNNCNLLKRLIDDFLRDDINDYIYQHLILCLQSLQKDQSAMQTLLKTQHNRLFEMIKSFTQMDKKIIFIKSVIQIALRIPEWICDQNPQFFGKLFNLANELNESDPSQQEAIEDIVENILWLQSTLLELNIDESQTEKAIQMSIEHKTAHSFVQNLKSQNERIVLQALKGLSVMASIHEFRPTLLIDQADKLFLSIADIINNRIKTFKTYQLEIETNIITMMASLTSAPSGATKDPLTVAARRRAVQQGFVDNFLKRCVKITYQIKRDDMGSDMQDYSDEDIPKHYDLNRTPQGLNNTRLTDLTGINIQDNQFDDIERINSQNAFLEETIQLVSNVTELMENHYALVNPQCQMLPWILQLAHQYLDVAANNQSDIPVNMLEFDFGNLKMAKQLAKILMNLVLLHPNGKTDIQEICSKNGFGQLMTKLCQGLMDYDIHSNLNQGLIELVLSPNAVTAQAAVEQGCLQHLISQSEESQFHKVRRITQEALDQVPQNLTDLNTKLMKKKLF